MRVLSDYIPKAVEILQACDIPYGKVESVESNSRFRARWGDCGYTDRKAKTFRIRISTHLLHEDVPERSLMDTLLHEYLHTCPGCQNHGMQWKVYAARINARYGYSIKRTNSEKEKEVPEGRIQHRRMERKYAIQCCRCGKVFRYARKTKAYATPYRYHCGTCGGSLKRVS